VSSGTFPKSRPVPRFLVGGIGNVFFGDDGFGVEVVRRLAERPLPSDVVIKDFGIRGFDLVFALMEPYEAVLLVDIAPRGRTPGTLTWLVPEPSVEAPAEPAMVDGHRLDPAQVLRMVQTMGGTAAPVELVTCEPSPGLGLVDVDDADGGAPEDEPRMGLSDPVAAAVPGAIAMIEAWVKKRIAGSGAAANA
jgi:hydrogenase maturation protease